LLLGTLRFNASTPPQGFDEGHVANYNDQGWVKIEGIVSGEPDVRDNYTNLPVEVSKIEVDGQEHEVIGTVLVRAPHYPQYDYGDELAIEGLLETPPVLEDFSYREYLARQGIYSILRRSQITLVDRGQGSAVRRALFAFKEQAQKVIALILHEPQAALLTGILLGVETGIPADLTKAFSTTGTAHIIAISGFNISIIAGLFSGLSTRLLGKRRAMPVALAGIIVYAILVGASASVVRAAIMGCLYVIAIHYGRQTDALTSLIAAAVLMTLLNPQTLWDVGFQLSFAATLGLILYTPVLQNLFERLLSRALSPGTAKRAIQILNEALIVSLAAQITTLPIIVYNFRQLSLVTLLSNFLVLPAQAGKTLCIGVVNGC
jgi:competence protein ComEC